MLWALALAVSVVPADPRPGLVELQLANRHPEALARVEQELTQRPVPSRQIGLDYLRGHLLDRLGRRPEAAEAFATTMAATPRLDLYSRYRLALDQERMGHPEVAAGLIARVVARDPGSPLLSPAVRLFSRTLARGGDCRLLHGIALEALPPPEKRALLVAKADCSLRDGERELARTLFSAVLEEKREDEWARVAAERLARLEPAGQGRRLPLLLGLTFHQHREFDRGDEHLRRAIERGGASAQEVFEARYAIARSQFLQARYGSAAVDFGRLAGSTAAAEDRARSLYQQGRSYELWGNWRTALSSFVQAYTVSPEGEWAAAALLAVVRLQARSGAGDEARRTWMQLASRWQWRENAARGALFLAASDLVRGRTQGVSGLLAAADRGGLEERLEAAYWRGRLAEAERDAAGALTAYLGVLRADPWHPFAQAARRRLAAAPLGPATAAVARRLSASGRGQDLLDTWLLLGEANPLARSARLRLARALAADRQTSPFVRLIEVPVPRWNLWDTAPRTAEEMLLALGIWTEGAPAVPSRFPPIRPALAFTGSRELARAGEVRRSIGLVEALRARTPSRVPLAVQPELRRLLYPLAWEEPLRREAARRGVDPLLLAAIVREESGFDPSALSPAADRGLAQLSLPRARQLAAAAGMGALGPEDLDRPEVSLALGAAQLAELLRAAGGAPHLAVAAYEAGSPQAKLWRVYCFSEEPEEYLSKVGFRDSRTYLRKVLAAWAHYRELYPAR